MSTEAERAFHSEMVTGADRLKKEIGYNPTRFLNMVANVGGPEAARQLLSGRDASDGFTTLWEAGRLEMSVEATVLLPFAASLTVSQLVLLDTCVNTFSEERMHARRVLGFLLLLCRVVPSTWGARRCRSLPTGAHTCKRQSRRYVPIITQ